MESVEGDESQATAGNVALAEGIFLASSKCHAILRLYPPYHVHCVSAIGDFVTRLKEYVDAHDALRISVKQETLELDGQVVYSEEKQSENLALCFFMDGLRELTVFRGIDTEAAKKLVLVFHETLQQREADSLLLLWEADIPNIDYVALNSLMDPWEPPDYFTPAQVEHVKQMNRDAEAIIAKLWINSECGEFTVESSPAVTARTPKVRGTKKLRAALGDLDDDVFETHREGLTATRKELVAWDSPRLLKTVVGHTLDGLALTPEIVTEESGEWLLRKAIGLAVEGRDVELLADVLTRLVDERALELEGGTAAILERVFTWLGEREFNSSLVGMTRGGLIGTPAALCKVLDCLGAAGLATAVQLYVQAYTEELGPSLVDFVLANLSRDPEAIRPLLEPTMPGHVVTRLARNVAEQVEDDVLMTELLNLARQHKEEIVSVAATGLWRANTSQGQLAKLVGLLMSDNRMNRLGALKQLVDADNRRAVPKLKAVIESSEFPERNAEERAAFMDGLWRLGGPAAVAFLQAQTRRTTGLFNRAAIKEIRASAQSSLALLKESREKERSLGD